MDNELDGFASALDQSVQPTSSALDTAKKIIESLARNVSLEDLIKLAELITNVIDYFKKPTVRWAIKRADSRPNGIVAYFVRAKVKAKLPESFRTDDVAKLVIAAASEMV